MKIYTDKGYIITAISGMVGATLIIAVGVLLAVIEKTGNAIAAGIFIAVIGALFGVFAVKVYGKNYFQWFIVDGEGIRVKSLCGEILFLPWKKVKSVSVKELPLFYGGKLFNHKRDWFVFSDGREKTDESTGVNGRTTLLRMPKNSCSEKLLALYCKDSFFIKETPSISEKQE